METGFNGIVGHERPVRLLKSMLASDRLPHALLLSGPAGVGKRTLAMALARAVNCLDASPSEAPCNACLSCRKIDRGAHPDVVELEPEGKAQKIKVDTVRELRSQIAFRPFEGRCKVFIIKQADRMQEEAANALLKTLEEPPPQSLLILTAPEESDLLTTIVSRCLRIKLAPLSRRTMEDWLIREKGATGSLARLLASMAEGCLGKVMEMDAENIVAQRSRILNFVSKLNASNPAPALNWASETAGDDESWALTFTLLRFLYRDLMIMTGGGSDAHLINEDIVEIMSGIAAGCDSLRFSRALEEIDRAEDALNRFVRPELVFDNMALALADIGRGIYE